MFEMEGFLENCHKALLEHSPQLAMKEVVERAVSDPGPLEGIFGTLSKGGIETLFNSSELTVLHVVWPPTISIFPHDHRMWAVIGVYGGQEDNIFYRRSPEGLQTAGGEALTRGDTIILGPNAIHTVKNPKLTFTGAIHVYGGDFFKAGRSEWDPETLQEQPFRIDGVRQAMAEATERTKQMLKVGS